MGISSATRSRIGLLAVLQVLAQAVVTTATPFNWSKIKYLIAFGDSYTYVQGTAGYPGYSFLGDFLPGDFAYTPSQLLTDQIIQNFTGTAEGGPNWVEYLTGCAVDNGVWSPLNCTGVQLWDFAFAGSDVSVQYTPLHHNFTIPLVNQTQQYLTYGHQTLSRKLCMSPSNTLVAIWIGINDISDSAKYNLTALGYPSFPVYYGDIISTLFNGSVAGLYDAGYRNFLLMNLPPLDRTPGNVGKTNPSPNATQIGWWDSALSLQAATFELGYGKGDSKVMVFDANTFLNGVLDDPSAYGIVNTTNYCAGYLYADVLTDPGKYGCPTPISEYFWFNTGHMTSHVHSVLAPEVANFLQAQST